MKIVIPTEDWNKTADKMAALADAMAAQADAMAALADKKAKPADVMAALADVMAAKADAMAAPADVMAELAEAMAAPADAWAAPADTMSSPFCSSDINNSTFCSTFVPFDDVIGLPFPLNQHPVIKYLLAASLVFVLVSMLSNFLQL